jgi:hypothetical protein
LAARSTRPKDESRRAERCRSLQSPCCSRERSRRSLKSQRIGRATTCFATCRTGVAPQANIQLDVDLKEWPKLIQIFEKFGAAHNLSFRNSSQSKPGVVEMLYLSLCNEKGVNVSVNDQRWASRNYAPFVKGGTNLTVYELRAESGWERIVQRLVSELDSTWPGRVRFFPKQTDRSGGSK